MKVTGKPLEIINADVERDNFMSADEAKAYGLVDDVITTHKIEKINKIKI